MANTPTLGSYKPGKPMKRKLFASTDTRTNTFGKLKALIAGRPRFGKRRR